MRRLIAAILFILTMVPALASADIIPIGGRGRGRRWIDVERERQEEAERRRRQEESERQRQPQHPNVEEVDTSDDSLGFVIFGAAWMTALCVSLYAARRRAAEREPAAVALS